MKNKILIWLKNLSLCDFGIHKWKETNETNLLLGKMISSECEHCHKTRNIIKLWN
jgi:hypothetical protein